MAQDPFLWLSRPVSNQMLRLEDENATFPAGSPRHVIRRGIWCPVQALGTIKCSKSENSSVFLQISPCPWLKCSWERERERETERAYRIRPLGVTVLSRIRPAPLAQTRALTHCNKMVSRRAIYCSRSLGLAFSLSWQHREGPVLHWVPLCRDGWLMAEATTLELLTKSNFSQRRQSWPQLWLPSSFLEPSGFICPKLQTPLPFFFF